MKRLTCLAASLLLSTNLVAQVPAGPGDYPQWRGPNRDGISNEKGLVKEWPAGGPAIAWQIDDVGVGYSSVAIKDGLIVTMGDLNGVEHIIALRASDGARVWAVQPQPIEIALTERVNQAFTSIDRNGDGTIKEIEALSQFGLDFYKYDRGDDAGNIAVRAANVFAALDVGAATSIADIASSDSEGDRMKMFYREFSFIFIIRSFSFSLLLDCKCSNFRIMHYHQYQTRV